MKRTLGLVLGRCFVVFAFFFRLTLSRILVSKDRILIERRHYSTQPGEQSLQGAALFGLRARSEFEYVGRKPLGDGLYGRPRSGTTGSPASTFR